MSMCGIVGFIDATTACDEPTLKRNGARMADAVVHRGPDSDGVWADPATGVVLGHRRLAVIDLSDDGAQPMVSASGRYVLTFNGEIYNFPGLRRHLKGFGERFRGGSDTEVLLAAIDRWGIVEALRRSNGMFALALWDRHDQRLWLARDRFGEKPLYYGWSGTTFLFGSQLAALHAHPCFAPDVDRDALALYFRHNYVPAPYSVYRDVHKLPAGCVMEIDPRVRQTPVARAYWSATEVIDEAVRRPVAADDQEACHELDRLLAESVRHRAVADVPLGAFLSGGVDSSTVVALLQAQCTRPLATFTMGFAEAGYDEAADAAAIARHLGTDHTELYVTPAEAMAVIPRLPELYDEPLGDASQLPTFLMCQLARRQVTVVLSGDGGDELFGGYARYPQLDRLWRARTALPKPARRALAALLDAWTPDRWDALARRLTPLPPSIRRKAGARAQKLAGFLAAAEPVAAYRLLMSHWLDPNGLVIGGREPSTAFDGTVPMPALSSPMEQAMFVDLVTYLPGDVLTKVDRASMAVGLEARVPLLDPAVFEFAWRLPSHMRQRDGRGKWLLRQVLHRYVPPTLVDRPKQGFAVPIGAWLRGPLREWAEELLSPSRLAADGYLDVGTVRGRWEDHVAGLENWGDLLWDVLMFQAWLEAKRR